MKKTLFYQPKKNNQRSKCIIQYDNILLQKKTLLILSNNQKEKL